MAGIDPLETAPADEPVYTVADVARALGVDVDTVRKWETRGVLPFTPQRVTVPGQTSPVRVFSGADLERLRVWFVHYEETRGAGGRPPHLKRTKTP